MPGLDAQGISQAIGLAQGQAMKIIGGVPILKNLSNSTLERLKLPKHLDAGNVGGLLKKVIEQGPGALLQNPLAAAQGALASAMGQAQAQVSTALGVAAGPVTAALGSLSTAAGNLSAMAGNLAGLTNAAGMPNSFDLLGHVGMAASLGDALPASMGLDVATAPLRMAGQFAAFATEAQGLAQAAAAGTMTPAAAAASILALAAQIDAAGTAARGALDGLAAVGPALAAGSAAVACLVPGAMPDVVREAMGNCIAPAAAEAVEAAVAAHVAQFDPPPIPAPEALSMPDLDHLCGYDLKVGPTGDLATVDGPQRGVQRVLRRLLTPLRAYLQHQDYGAGLSRRVGDTVDEDEVSALVRSQIFLEAAVAREPEPDITVTAFANGMRVRIVYADAPSGEQKTLSFEVT